MRIDTWEAALQRRRMRRAHWLGVLFVALYALVAISVVFGGLH